MKNIDFTDFFNVFLSGATIVRALFFPEGGLRTAAVAYSALLSASSMGIFRMRRKSKIVTMA